MKNNKYFLILISLIIQSLVASVYANPGNFFSVFEDCQVITPYEVSLCLNGKGALSCQKYIFTKSRLLIKTTIPQHVYEQVGIKIESSLVKPGNCTVFENGYCLFSANDSTPAAIDIVSVSEMKRIHVC